MKTPKVKFPLVTIKESPIHGKGLFADQAIKAGQTIGNIKTRPAKKDGPYVLWIGNTKAREVTCDLKYINHSSRPNCVYYDDGSVVALKNIKQGTELTHKYDS